MARWLVELLIPGRHREAVLGDLDEEFDAAVRPENVGVQRAALRRARLRYWRAALGSIVATRRTGSRRRDGRVDGRTSGWLPGLRQDVRIALRQLRTRPAFALAVIVTLGLGIGATTAVFSLVNWTLLRPVPGIADPGGLITIELIAPETGDNRGFGYADLLDFEAGAPSIAAIVTWEHETLQVAAPDGRAVAVDAEIVSGDYFGILGVRPAAGRLIRPEETHPQRPVAVGVVTPVLAADLFGEGVDPIGRVVRVNATPIEIIGVMDPAFHGIERFRTVSMWLPYSVYPDIRHFPASVRPRLAARGASTFHRVVARLAAGATPERAAAELERVAGGMLASYPDEAEIYATYRPRVTAGANARPASVARDRRTSALMLGVVGLVLAIACANVANLLIFRGVDRRGEAAVRRALGASGGRLVRQQLAESMVLAFAGGGLALVFILLVRSSASAVLPAGIAGVGEVPIDARVLLFAACVSVCAGVLTGLVPTALSRRVDLSAAMRGSDGRTAPGGAWFRRGLVVVQLALTLPLLVGATLLVRTIQNLLDVELGFEPAAVHWTLYDLEPQGYRDEAVAAFHAGMLAGLRSSPSMEAIALSAHVPFSGISSGISIAEDAAGREPGGAQIDVDVQWVSAGFFDVLGLPIEEGRPLLDQDLDAPEAGPQNVVVSRSLARALFGERPAVGRSFTTRTFAGPRELRVVGVAADARMRSPTSDPGPVLYQPIDASIYEAAHILVRARDGAGIAVVQEAVRAAVARMDASIPFRPLAPLEELLAGRTGDRRLLATLLAAAATLAALLAAIGFYGLLSAVVAERDREIGIRIALGAAPRRIAGIVAGEVGAVTVAGLVIGTAGALALARVLASRLFGVAASDPAVLAAAAAAVPLIALLAAVVPARRAARLDPAVMLRAAGEGKA